MFGGTATLMLPRDPLPVFIFSCIGFISFYRFDLIARACFRHPLRSSSAGSCIRR